MIKPLHRIIPILALSATLLCGCVDHDYDLSDIDADNISLGGELVMPLGKVGVRIDELQELIGTGSFKIPIPGKLTTPPLPIKTPFDSGILDKLDDKTPITIQAEVTSCVSIPMLLSVKFATDDKEIVLFDSKAIKGSGSGITSLSSNISMEDFEAVAKASNLTVTLATLSGRVEEGTITSDATLNIKLSVQKSGGIKL